MALHMQTSGSHFQAILDPVEVPREEPTAPHENEEEPHGHGEKYQEHEGKQERRETTPNTVRLCRGGNMTRREMLNARKQEGQR